MFNGYFIQALHEEFYRVFDFNPRSPAITSVETAAYHDFGLMYLMGPFHGS